MWTPLIFLTIVGLAIGGQSPWVPRQEYTYNIYARTLTAFPDLKNQYVGIVTKGKLVIQPRSETQIVGKLVKIAHAHYHDELPTGWDSQIPEQGLSYKESDLNDKPFIINLKNGVIKSIEVDRSMSNDQVNQLKAVLSQLQVDIKGENLIKDKHNHLPEKNNNVNALYKTMEPTVTGECETVYDIEPMPEYLVEQTYPSWAPISDARVQGNKDKFFQIVKQTNFDRCNLRKGYHFGITGDSYDFKPNTNKMGDALSKSSMTKIVASGDANNYIIHQVYTTNRIAVSPAMYEDQKAQVVSQIQLNLVKVQDASQKIEEPQQKVNTGNLVYRYNIPSDKDNKIREGTESSTLLSDAAYRTSSNEDSKEHSQERSRRLAGLLSRKGRDSSSSSSSSSSESIEYETSRRHLQPEPNMRQAPEIPLHPLTIGNKGRSVKYDSQVDLERIAVQLTKEIADDLQHQDEITKRDTLEKFDTLCDVIALMNVDQIQKVAQELNINSQKSDNLSETLVRKVIRDAVSQAGTGPAVTVVSKWILEGKIKGDEAADMLTAVTKNIKTPVKEVIKTLFNLVKNDKVKQQRSLYPTALIAFTDLIRNAQVDKNTGYNYYPVQAFGPFYKYIEEIVTKEIIPYFGERLDQSVQQKHPKEILLYMRALGNIAHPDIIAVYEKYMEGKDQLTAFEHTAMVLSMDKLANVYPSVARRILYKIYANIATTPETRTAAVQLLMRTQPSAAMLQRMAEYTHVDPSEAVQAVVKSAIESAAELSDIEWAELASNARAAREYLNPREYGQQYSKTYLRDYVSDNLKMVYRQQLSHIVGRDNTFPQALLFKVNKIFGGFETQRVEVQAMISSVDQLLRLVPNGEYADWETTKGESQSGNNQWSTQRVSKLLNIEAENAPELEGQILLKMMGQKHYFAFDEKVLKELPQNLAAIGSGLMNGEKLTYNKLYNRRQVTIAFPLATGYPFVYTYRMPTLFQAIGDVKAETTPNVMKSPSWKSIRGVEAVNVTLKTHLVFSTEQISKIGFVTPFEHQRYVAGHVRKIQGHIPLNLRVDIDINNREIAGKVTTIDNAQSFEALHISAYPFTTRKDVTNFEPVAKLQETKLIKTRPTQKYERTIGKKTIGMAFRTSMEHQLRHPEMPQTEEALQTQGILSLTSLPYSFQSTMNKIADKRAFSWLSFLPFAFEPASFGPSEKQLIAALAVLPLAEELSTPEIVKAQGIMSLLGLPFADVETLERTVNHQGILEVNSFPAQSYALDYFKYNVRYDAEQSPNHAMKFAMKLSRAFNTHQNAASSRMTGPASMDELKLAEATDSKPNSETRRQQFLENVAFDIKQASAVALDASVVFEGQKTAEYVFTIAHANSPTDEKNRVLAFVSTKSADKPTEKQMCLAYSGKFPYATSLNFEEALKMNNKANAKIHVAYGQNCKSSPSKINVRFTMEQTPEYKEYLRQSEIGKHCQHEMKQGDYQMPGCLEATYRANVLNHINIAAQLENPTPEMYNITHGAYALLRHIAFWHVEENVNAKGQHNKMDAVINVHPNLKHLDAYIQTETMTQRLNNFYIQPALQPFFNVHQQMDVKQRNMRELFQNGDMCVVDNNKVLTFDDKIINSQIGQCWYSAFQYAEPKYSFVNDKEMKERDVSVLIRSADQSNSKKEVMIIVGQKNGPDHVAHIKYSGSTAQVSVNGQEKQFSSQKFVEVFDAAHGHDGKVKPALRIAELAGHEIKIEVREKLVQLFFDGARLRLQACPSYRNNVRGLCGNYNGEQIDDQVTPKKCILRNDKLIVASWALDEQSCSNEVKQAKSKVNETPCERMRYENSNVISTWESGKRSGKQENRRKWSSESSSSSSSSSSEEDRNRSGRYSLRGQDQGKACNLKKQIQYIDTNDRTCFSTEPLPACPLHCHGEDKEPVQVPVHCRSSEDSVAQMFKQQIRKGVNPDMSSKKINHNITFNIPSRCVPATA